MYFVVLLFCYTVLAKLLFTVSKDCEHFLHENTLTVRFMNRLKRNFAKSFIYGRNFDRKVRDSHVCVVSDFADTEF